MNALSRKRVCWLATAILAAACTPLAAVDESQAQECARLLSSVGSNSLESPLRRREAITRIDALRSELQQGTFDNVVVYALVAAAAGVSIIRYEQLQGNQLAEEIVTQTSTTPEEFRRMTSAARQPESYFARMLKTAFDFVQGERDKGKQVFLMDTDAFGIVPQSFDLPNATLFASSSLQTAIANLSTLGAQPHPATRRKLREYGDSGSNLLAIRALGRMGSDATAAVPELIERLTEGVWAEKEAALITLGLLGQLEFPGFRGDPITNKGFNGGMDNGQTIAQSERSTSL
jgi:hypothetical protein